MNGFLAIFPQVMLSAGTLGVAALVYRVQADKLFLEMRGERLASLDRFKAAGRARFEYILSIRFENLETSIVGGTHEAMMRAYRDAERDLCLWFGDDVGTAAKGVDCALGEYEQRTISFQSEMPPRKDFARHRHATLAMGDADKKMSALITLANRYVAAGRRGLPFADRLKLSIRRKR